MIQRRAPGADLNQVFDDPPPPYPGLQDETETQRTASPTPSLTTFPTPTPVTRFPRVVKGYRLEDRRQHFNLGPSAGQPMFQLCTEYNPYVIRRMQMEESIHLHAKPNGKLDSVLATVHRDPCPAQKRHTVITLHAVPGIRNEEEEVLMHQLKDRWGVLRSTVEFQFDVDGWTESFQWRPSRGREIRKVGGWTSGWKLVRMGRLGRYDTWKTNDREGFASDGNEIVAVIAVTYDMTRDFTFAFLGSGADGALGETWKTVAVVSGIWNWWNSVKNTSLYCAGYRDAIR